MPALDIADLVSQHVPVVWIAVGLLVALLGAVRRFVRGCRRTILETTQMLLAWDELMNYLGHRRDAQRVRLPVTDRRSGLDRRTAVDAVWPGAERRSGHDRRAFGRTADRRASSRTASLSPGRA